MSPAVPTCHDCETPVESIAQLHASKALAGKPLCPACFELATVRHQRKML